ncbi:MAG TPA: class I SAM-dependent methyltransferase [Solimonas sp.]
MSSGSLSQLVAKVAERRPMHARFIEDAYAFLREDERTEADGYVAHLLETESLDTIAAAYETIVDDTFEAQMYFMEHGRYRHSKFEEVAGAVYFNPEYMKRYMLGLAVSNYLWPNHVQIRRFFAETFPWRREGTYFEVGPGHGLFLLLAMQQSQLSRFIGLDISATSLALTDETVRHALPQLRDKLQLIEADFFGNAGVQGPFDVLVMGEVLEHVERPIDFLKRLRALAAPGAHLFVTTCINAPAIDHIMLFESEQHVEDTIAEAGLKIERKLSVPYPGKSLKQCVSGAYPINVAYVLSV